MELGGGFGGEEMALGVVGSSGGNCRIGGVGFVVGLLGGWLVAAT